jgi:hypothetical protein
MKQEIQVPTKLSDITLEQFQAFNRVLDETDNEIFITHKMISTFCKIRMSDVIRIRQIDNNSIAETLRKMLEGDKKFVQRFTLGGKEFGFIPNLEDISSGEYADLDKYISDWETMHKALAVMYRPIVKTKGDKYEIEPYEGSATYAEVMKYAPLDVAFGSLVFFYHLGRELLKATLNYLEKEVVELAEMNIQHSLSSTQNGDGTTTSMHSLKETLEALRALRESDCFNVLPFFPTKRN